VYSLTTVGNSAIWLRFRCHQCTVSQL